MFESAYTATEWPIQKNQELNRRKWKAKEDYKGEDGMFRCVVLECGWSKGRHNKELKRHLMPHTEALLVASGKSIEVIESRGENMRVL